MFSLQRSLPLYILILTMACNTVSSVRKEHLVKLAFIAPWLENGNLGKNAAPGFAVGLQSVKDKGLLPGYEFQYQVRDSSCNAFSGMHGVVDMWLQSEEIDVIIGDACSVVCQPVALLASAWNIPIISFYCGSDALSKSSNYPTFSRVVGGYRSIAPVLVQITRAFSWSRIGILLDTADIFQYVATEIKNEAESMGTTVLMRTLSTTTNIGTLITKNLEIMRSTIRKLKDEVRIMVILMYDTDIRNALAIAHEEKMLNGEYAFLGLEQGPQFAYKLYRQDLADSYLWQGWIQINHKPITTPEYERFEQRCLKAADLPAFSHLPKIEHPDEVNYISALAHDAVMAWAIGANRTLEDGDDISDGVKVTSNIYNLTFMGMTGEVKIDYKGDRAPNYQIKIYQSGTAVPIFEWVNGQMKKVYKANKPNDWSGIVWSGNQINVPLDTPACGWLNELCPKTSDNTETEGIITGITIALAIILGLCVVEGLRRKIITDRKIKAAETCIIEWPELESNLGMETQRSFNTSSLSTNTQSDEKSEFNSVEGFAAETIEFRGDLAVLKKLGSRLIDIREKRILLELKCMRDMEHDNINAFVGICMGPLYIYVLMQYASRGSLHDVLRMDSRKLTWEFKISLIVDISRGLKYIHTSEIGYHGRLTSTNVVVDGRWIAKITDYGLRKLKAAETSPGTIVPASKLIWTAPEHLRQPLPILAGSKEGDIYSLGIIVQEVVLEDEPFCRNKPRLISDEIVEKVRIGGIGGEPIYRPDISGVRIPKDWINLMQQCWHEDPHYRPNITNILSHVKKINHGKETNLVESIVMKVESHTKYLEETVRERTLTLQEEKRKLDYLLEELLPRSVVNSLATGKTIDPESFESSTILFSDMVGFTKISAAATPLQVVKMLNQVYTLFDDICTNYDCFKVATIGDAYFVASGVPTRNGDKHVSEICTMALELLQAVKNFPIPHKPDETLKLRTGIHTGTCVAGVAGIKMPRYLLFGETVDLASAMEASGVSMKIHITKATTDALENQPERFITELRGMTKVKGIGEMMTYWLLEKRVVVRVIDALFQKGPPISVHP